MSKWHAFDLDGVVAEYHGWEGADKIGKPIPAIVARIKDLLAAGEEVRILTARASTEIYPDQESVFRTTWAKWSIEVFGKVLPATSDKDQGMIILYDDRARYVPTNSGRTLNEMIEDYAIDLRSREERVDPFQIANDLIHIARR